MSSGAGAPAARPSRARQRARTMPMMAESSLRTRDLCANHSGVGVHARHGDNDRALHSSMMGKYRLGNSSSLCSGCSDRMASPITCSVRSRNSFSMSTDAPRAFASSSLTHSRSAARLAMAMISSRISTRSALLMWPRMRRQLSPPLVTRPVPRISRNGAYENSVSLE